MSVSRLQEESARVIPFKIEYPFAMAYAEFVWAHPELDHVLSKRWHQAFKLAESFDLEAAAGQFETLTCITGKTSFTALFNLAMCHLLRGRFADAAIQFQRAEKSKIGEDYWLHIYSGIAYFALGLVVRANLHWWIASRLKNDDVGRNLIKRFFTAEHHPERMALYPLCKGKGIDVGCGYYKIQTNAIGVDLVPHGERMATAANVMDRVSQADVVCSGDNLVMFDDESLDYVVQRHNLEHYQDPVKALQEWLRVIKPGGIIGMVVPDDESCDTIHLDTTHKHVYTQSSLRRLLELLPSVKVVHLESLLYRWSFVCVAQKVGQDQGTTFDYRSCIKEQENDEVRRRIDWYVKHGFTGLGDQCRRYLERNSER